MVSLEELQRQFMAVQEAAPTQMLSERACVDIVVKLMEKKKIQLVTTTNGKEFVTLETLAQEIRTHLANHKGRVNVIEMATALGVSPDIVEAKTEEMTRRSRHLMLLDGDLISTLYLNMIAGEIENLLEEKGQLTIAELSQKYSLPAEFLRQEIHARLGTVIHGELKNQYLTTAHFSRRVESIVRGVLTAACRPVAVSAIATEFNLPNDSVTNAAVQLIRLAQLQGRLQSGIFTPARFSTDQSDKVTSFYKANAFVPFSLAKDCGFSDAHGFLQKEFPEGIPLATVYVHPQLVAPLHANLQEAVAASSWADLSSLFPAALTPEDAHLLLLLAAEESASGRKGASPSTCKKPLPLVTFDDGVALSHGFLDIFCQAVAPFLAKKAAAEAEKSTAGAAAKHTEENSHNAGPASDDSDEEAEGRNRRRGKGARRGRGDDKKKKKSAAATSAPASGTVTLGDIEEACSSDASDENSLADLWTSLPPHVQQRLWETVQARLDAHYQRCVADSRRSLREQQRAKTERRAANFQEEFESIVLAVKGLEALGILDDAKHPLVVHLFKTSVGTLLDSLVEAAVAEATSEPPQVNTQNRRQCLEKAAQAGGDVENLLRACDVVQKRAGADLIDSLQGAAEDSHILLRVPDKRRVKQLVSSRRAAAQEALASSTSCDPAAVLHAALGLLLVQRTSPHGSIPFPKDFWAATTVWALLGNGAAGPGEFAGKSSLALADVQPLWLAVSAGEAGKARGEAAADAPGSETHRVMELEASKLLNVFAERNQKK
ncbi:putative E3 UFM1-protein ligase 1 [Toxoplasma gondii VAND]|uniref:Putative E3 UFM1-protein ligase 1 n=1 Tax=Toxoplasma gondii VAND TaxID=933077 RepID=A0A086PT59_TOXGO|nr:putative E3 UFM1-protein ligase 1 [Toxoplasma gondii VAND]